MANAKDFVSCIVRIDGVSDCLLILNNGKLIARTSKNAQNYSTLVAASGKMITGIMKTAGFGPCRHLCFSRENQQHYHVFFIDKYLLGLEQQPDCHIPDMLEGVYRLIERVSTIKSNINHAGS